jgi:DNA-binding CsgD family transcriptional regulator
MFATRNPIRARFDIEQKVLRRLAMDKTDEEIAVEIGGAEQQIGQQCRRLIERFRILSPAQLVAAAERLAAWPARPRSVRSEIGRR